MRAFLAILLLVAIAAAAAATDFRHLVAQSDGASEKRAYADVEITSPGPLSAAQQAALGLPAGNLVAARLEGWLWNDLNADGYIGSPSATTVAAYTAGAPVSPNDLCVGPAPCETDSVAAQLAGRPVRVAPGPAGWPPGSVVLRDFAVAGGASAHPILVPTLAIDLRIDAACAAPQTECPTIDAIFVPGGALFPTTAEAGSATGPVSFATHQAPGFLGGVTIDWVEGWNYYSIAFPTTAP